MIISLLWPRLFSTGRKVSLQKDSNFIIIRYLKDLKASPDFSVNFENESKTSFLFDYPISCHWSLSITLENIINLLFSDIFRRYRKRSMTWNGLILSKFLFLNHKCQCCPHKKKPLNTSALQINWLVSIWGQHWHLMG